MEKNLKKELYICLYVIYIYIYVIHIFIYIKLNHFTVHLKLTQHCKSTMLQFKKGQWNFNFTKFPCAMNYFFFYIQPSKNTKPLLAQESHKNK